jgi:hypothetical protein
LTGFLIPSGTPPEKSSDIDEDDDFSLVLDSPGLAEESTEDSRAAKKGQFPSSIGLSFLISKDTSKLKAYLRWRDYDQGEAAGEDGKTFPVWKRKPREEMVEVALGEGGAPPVIRDLPGSAGLQLCILERQISAQGIKDQIPSGTRSVSLFLVNRRAPNKEQPDLAYAFQTEIEVRSDYPFVPRPDPRGVRAEDWDE